MKEWGVPEIVFQNVVVKLKAHVYLLSIQKYLTSIGVHLFTHMTCNLRIFTSTTATSRISILAATWTTTFWKTSSGIPPSIIAMRTFSTFIIIPSTNSCFFQKTFIIICFPISPTNWSERPITSYKKKKPRNISILSFFLT